MMEQVRLCLASGELTWHFQNHIQGWINDLNILLSCFRTKMSVLDPRSGRPSTSSFSRRKNYSDAPAVAADVAPDDDDGEKTFC